MNLKINKKFDHAFAIVRFDHHMADAFGFDPEQISVKQVVWSREAAEREVDRLNRLNADKDDSYFWRLTRLARVDESMSGTSTNESGSDELIPESKQRS